MISNETYYYYIDMLKININKLSISRNRFKTNVLVLDKIILIKSFIKLVS